MKKESSSNFLSIVFIIFFAVIIVYPVSMFIKNRSDLSTAITEEQKQSFISDQEILLPSKGKYIPLEPGARVEEGYQSVIYSNTGNAIIRVSITNVANLTQEQFRQVGRTPYSLLNTVRGNIKVPQVLDVVFNDESIIEAFFERETTAEFVSRPEILVRMVENKAPEISEFINHPAVQEALASPETLNVLVGSKLMANILESPTGQYFLNNPLEVKRLIGENEDVKALSQNENLRNLLLNFSATKQSAQVALN